MSRFCIIPVLSVASALFGCQSTPPVPEKVSAHTLDFRIEGQLGSISVADLDAIVGVMQPKKIHLLRIVSRNEVHIDTTPRWLIVGLWRHGHNQLTRVHPQEFSQYTVFKRVGGVWQEAERVFTIA